MSTNHYIKIKAIVGAICFCLTMGACTGNFENYNTDPNRATDEDLEKDMLALGGMFPSFMVDIIPTSDKDANEYQRAQNLSGDIFSGYMAAIGQWNNSNNNSTYNLFYSDWNDVGFNVAYRMMGYWSRIKAKSKEYGVDNAFDLAQILRVMTLHRITDNYGPIPYSKMGEGALGSPYDSQESVYKSFFHDLDNAIVNLKAFLKAAPNAKPLKKYDLIYGGDYSKWLVFANSLKLRLAMRIVYVEPVLAKKYAEEAVNDEYGVMRNNSDNAELKTALGVQVFNPLWVCWSRYGDIRMGASMESFLKGYKDPRLPKYFSPSSLPDAGYHGVRNGMIINNKPTYMQASSPNVMNSSTDSPILWMCAAEMYFLRAEGALRGWNMGGTAGELYSRGISTSLEQRGVTAAEAAAYTTDSTSTPAAFTDAIGGASISASTDIRIKWESNASFERNLEQIITQKWLAMFPEGQEAWTEFRRTGYPQLFPVANNNSGGTINTDKQVRRLPFPQSEYRANETEVAKAVLLLGGPDNGGTLLWWDKK